MKNGKAQKQLHREKTLLDAAEDIIFSHGLRHATMDEIAEHAGVSKGTLYYYFTDKNDLYLAINNRGLLILNNQLASVITEDLPGAELLRRMGEEYMRFVQQYPNYFRAFLHHENAKTPESDTSELDEQCERQVHRTFTYTVRALQIGMQDGTIDSRHEPEVLALELWGSIRGLTQLYYLKSQGHYENMFGEFEMTFENIFYNFIDIFLSGMQNDADFNKDK